MNELIIAVAVVGGVGLLFGILLAAASFVFEIKTDERAEKILEVLPGANCGACGYAGCGAYAEAIVKDGAPVNCCSVGKAPVAQKISDIMGVEAGEVVEMVARVACGGDCNSAELKYEYEGVHECTAEI